MATSATDPPFLPEVEQMLYTRGELLVELCYSRAAGSRDFMLFRSFSSFQERLQSLPVSTLVNVYRQYDLPLRGAVSESLIQSALNLVPSNAPYLVIYLQPRDDWRCAAEYDKDGGWLSSFRSDEGRDALERDLRDTLGEQVAIGPEPEWREQSGNVLWAVVPHADGSVQVGIY